MKKLFFDCNINENKRVLDMCELLKSDKNNKLASNTNNKINNQINSIIKSYNLLI